MQNIESALLGSAIVCLSVTVLGLLPWRESDRVSTERGLALVTVRVRRFITGR